MNNKQTRCSIRKKKCTDNRSNHDFSQATEPPHTSPERGFSQEKLCWGGCHSTGTPLNHSLYIDQHPVPLAKWFFREPANRATVLEESKCGCSTSRCSQRRQKSRHHTNTRPDCCTHQAPLLNIFTGTASILSASLECHAAAMQRPCNNHATPIAHHQRTRQKNNNSSPKSANVINKQTPSMSKTQKENVE